MKTITGTFRHPDGAPASKEIVVFTLSQDAMIIGNGAQVEPLPIKIQLDANGAIPAGTQILANDELHPDGTYYHVRITSGNGYYEQFQLIGSSPININALVPSPLNVAAGTQAKNIELQTNGTDNVSQTKLNLHSSDGSVTITDDGHGDINLQSSGGGGGGGGVPTSHVGFFAGPIHAPSTQFASVPADVGGTGLNLLAFTLPFNAVVNRVSIFVDTPASGGLVYVGLYDMGGNKICDVAINASSGGRATGVFPSTVNLMAGDYFFAWAGNQHGVQVHAIGVNDADQLSLMNAGNGLAGTAGYISGGALPATFTNFVPSTLSFTPPIMAYFTS